MSLPLRTPLDSVSFERALEDLIVRFIINVPPEDLATVERELFHFEEAQWFYTDFIKLMNPHLPKLKIKTFASYVISMCPLIWKWQDVNPDEALQKFSKYKKSIPVRGAAIFNENLNKILLVKGTESDSWSFPRGKISKDEDDVDCCIREVKEEIGFDLTNYIDDNQYVERNINGKNYKIYLVKGVPQDFAFKPQVRNEIEKIEWRDFWKLSRSLHKSNARYYLLNSMVKPLTLWVKKQKQIQNEEQLKQYAEEQLKLLLGISTQSENFDPGRELLNMIQSSVGHKNPISLVDDESQTSMSTSSPATIMTPSTANSQCHVHPAVAANYGITHPFPQNIMPAKQGLNPFPFVHGFPQGMFPHASYGGLPQQAQQTIPPQVVQVFQPPQTPIVKPTVIDEAGPSSRQLLELLKKPKKPELTENNSAKTLLDLLKNPKNRSPEQGETDSPGKNIVSPLYDNPISEKCVDHHDGSTDINGKLDSSSSSGNLSLYEKASPSDSADVYEDFESSSDEESNQKDEVKINTQSMQQLNDTSTADVPVDVFRGGHRFPKIPLKRNNEHGPVVKESSVSTTMESSPRSVKPSLEVVSRSDSNSEKFSAPSTQNEKSEKTKVKPKFKLLKRGEKFASDKPSYSPQPEVSTVANPEGLEVYQKLQEHQQRSLSPGSELLAMLHDPKSGGQPNPPVKNTAKELLSILHRPQTTSNSSSLEPVDDQRKSEANVSNQATGSQQSSTRELLNILHLPQQQEQSPVSPPVVSDMLISKKPEFLTHLPYVMSPASTYTQVDPLEEVTRQLACSPPKAGNPQNSAAFISLLHNKNHQDSLSSVPSQSAGPGGKLSAAQELLGLLKK